MGNLGHFPEAADVVLPYRTGFCSNISILLSPQFYLPAHDVNTQTLYPFSLSSREKVYLLKPNSDR